MPGRGGRRGSGRGSGAKKEEKVRKLVRWDQDKDTELLLAIQWGCNKLGNKIPWEMICDKYYGPPYTEGAITQHLAKLRLRRVENGQRVPPPLRRSPKEDEKKAAALKRKDAQNTKDESEESDGETVVSGLFVDEEDEYVPKGKRAKKAPKSNKGTTLKSDRSAQATNNTGLTVRRHALDAPEGILAANFPHHPSSGPSPFDVRYRDNHPVTVQATGGPEVHGATGESPASATQSQPITSHSSPVFAPQVVPWSTDLPIYPNVMNPQGYAFLPGFQTNPQGPPSSAGRSMAGSTSNMIMGQTFGPGYDSQNLYWYAPQTQTWMQSPVPPVRGQGSEGIDPQQLQPAAKAELKGEYDAADPAEDEGFDFKGYFGEK